MSRVYGEPVEVWARDGRPMRFVWRGRLYTVTRVIEHWMTTREWWQRQTAGDRPDPVAPVDREFWRVGAGGGLGSAPGVYELRHDLGSGGWLLSRAWE